MVKGCPVYEGAGETACVFTSSRQSPNKIQSHAQRATKIKGEVTQETLIDCKDLCERFREN